MSGTHSDNYELARSTAAQSIKDYTARGGKKKVYGLCLGRYRSKRQYLEVEKKRNAPKKLYYECKKNSK